MKAVLGVMPPAVLRLARRLRRILTLSLVAWSSVGAMLFLATVQPSAYSLDLPMVTHISLPATGEQSPLEPVSDPGVELFIQVKTSFSISANELALVSFASQQVEMARTPMGAKRVAKTLMADEFGWNNYQYGCLQTLWRHESNWNYKSHNKASGAHGIPQALPATKMEIVGTDWRTNPVTQITWGLKYIQERYNTPCAAWSKFKRSNWY